MAFVCEEHGDTRRLAQGKCRSEFTEPCCGRLDRRVASGNAVHVAFDPLDAGAIAPCSLYRRAATLGLFLRNYSPADEDQQLLQRMVYPPSTASA